MKIAANKSAKNCAKKTIKRKPKLKKKKSVEPQEYVFCSIVNTQFPMTFAEVVAHISRGILSLSMVLDDEKEFYEHFTDWFDSSQEMVFLNGYDHNFIKYIDDLCSKKRVKKHTSWRENDVNERQVIVLTIFGQGHKVHGISELADYKNYKEKPKRAISMVVSSVFDSK